MVKKEFNITGTCFPDKHYMVNIDKRIKAMRQLVEQGKYFVLNRARQYGKTTTLNALETDLQKDYYVVSLDFQILETSRFESSKVFARTFSRLFIQAAKKWEQDSVGGVIQEWKESIQEEDFSLYEMFLNISTLCDVSERSVVLMIDEVDSVSDNQVFLDFLAQLRAYYLKRNSVPALQSVILAGVYDIKNLRNKLRSEEEHRTNSPWNIAVDFTMDMSFSEEDIRDMLSEYEQDNKTGMDTRAMAKLLYDETAGYPFLVCRLCKIMDEELPETADYQTVTNAWTKEGFLIAERMLLTERNTLFDSLSHQMERYMELENILYSLLLDGERVSFNAYNQAIAVGIMLGFLKDMEGQVVVSNRIFETWLYNLFLSRDEMKKTEIYSCSVMERNQFITNGRLNMRRILERFVVHFGELYGEQDNKFIEEYGRRFFLLYLRPVINGTGNYYIEAQTRDRKRTDVIVDYHGEQFIIEMKIWHGKEYNERGKKQLAEYLDTYQKKTGYMISFNFNKNKDAGVKEVIFKDKRIIEAVV